MENEKEQEQKSQEGVQLREHVLFGESCWCELPALKARYERVCAKLDTLNEQATALEIEIQSASMSHSGII